jgi:hypothetical protein
VSVNRLAAACPRYSGRGTRALPRVGFPIRRSRDQRLVSTSPRLIAAAHVLHRLLAPRHPPCALHLLIVKNTVHLPLWSFQGAHRPTHRRPKPAEPGLSKLSSVCLWYVEVDMISRRTRIRTAYRKQMPSQSSSHRGNCPDIPRKEVIQPQLPLRLPCYDFTPVTNPTFGGCLPCGLAHRLRVLPASVV